MAKKVNEFLSTHAYFLAGALALYASTQNLVAANKNIPPPKNGSSSSVTIRSGSFNSGLDVIDLGHSNLQNLHCYLYDLEYPTRITIVGYDNNGAITLASHYCSNRQSGSTRDIRDTRIQAKVTMGRLIGAGICDPKTSEREHEYTKEEFNQMKQREEAEKERDADRVADERERSERRREKEKAAREQAEKNKPAEYF